MDCIPPNPTITRKDYVLTAATLGAWALYKQNEHWKARMAYYKCVEEKFKNEKEVLNKK